MRPSHGQVKRGHFNFLESCKYWFYLLVHTTARGGVATLQSTIIIHHTDLGVKRRLCKKRDIFPTTKPVNKHTNKQFHGSKSSHDK